MSIRLSCAPLGVVEAVALDLETTGLDVRTARMVQIGAVRIRAGALDSSLELSLLVDPGSPVPPSATAIHGISTEDLTGAAGPADALAELIRFLGDVPLVGHAVAYDLGVLAAEARRLRTTPLWPRSLDTRLLSEVVAPSLPDYTLETLATWLGLEAEGRHSAIGDARTTARIFCALIPRLRERGIRTWAEAERACRDLPRQPSGLAVGRNEPEPTQLQRDLEPLSRIDSYPYRHRVADIMSPPQALPEDRPVMEAVRVMIEERISSVFVEGAEDFGILTERDVLRLLVSGGVEALHSPAGRRASRPLRSVQADSFVYRAIARMSRLKLRHLAVLDDAGTLVGALSARDLLKLRASQAIELGDAIEVAQDVPALAAAWAPLPAAAEALLAEEVDAIGVAAVISSELRSATRRAAEIAEAELAAEGMPAPAPYAVLVLGSAGRGESLLALDQDNAIVFAGGEPGGPQDLYFAKLGARLADILDAIGVPYCKGGVMAKEPAWRGSLETWRGRIAQWLSRSSPQDLLSVDIFFDACAVHGDQDLARRVLAEGRSEASRAPQFLKLLAAASPDPPAAFGLFGQFRTEQGRIDLKRAALLPIVSAARILAIRYAIEGRSTPERLAELRERQLGGEADILAMESAFGVALAAILRQQIGDIQAGIRPSSRVEAARLPREEQARLREALRIAPRLDELVRDLLF